MSLTHPVLAEEEAGKKSSRASKIVKTAVGILGAVALGGMAAGIYKTGRDIDKSNAAKEAKWEQERLKRANRVQKKAPRTNKVGKAPAQATSNSTTSTQVNTMTSYQR